LITVCQGTNGKVGFSRQGAFTGCSAVASVDLSGDAGYGQVPATDLGTGESGKQRELSCGLPGSPWRQCAGNLVGMDPVTIAVEQSFSESQFLIRQGKVCRSTKGFAIKLSPGCGHGTAS